MMRRPTTLPVCLLCWATWACSCGAPAAKSPDLSGRPGSRRAASTSPSPRSAEPIPPIDNIVLITIDTLRWDALGFSGNVRAETPTLDRLASVGKVFLDTHAHNVVTLPSHANILTGLYPYQHKIRDNKGFQLDASIPTAATLLQEVGFRTAAFVGAFPLDSRFGLDRGFEVYDDKVPEGSRPTELVPAERRGDVVVKLARQWWTENQGQRRFLWMHLYDPHAPYEPAEPFSSRFADDPYLGEVAAVDAYLRPFLEPFLLGQEAPTLIVFTSDHGEALGDHGELTHGLFAYEATLKVPLLIWYPGAVASVRSDSTRHVDLLPTMLEAVGVDAPDSLSGRSLLGDRVGSESVTYFEALSPNLDRGWAPLRGVLVDGDKYISLPIAELYDLKSDPNEQQNLVTVDTARVAELTRHLPQESSWPPTQREAVDVETVEALRSLGYLSGAGSSKTEFNEADDPKRLIHLDSKMHEVVELYSTGRLEQAEAKVLEVLRERPEMSIAYYYLGQVLLQQGKLAEAIEVMGRAQQEGLATPALTRQLGMSLAEIGRAEEGVKLLQPLAENGNPDALNALGLVLTEAGDQRQAQIVLERVFEIDPRNAITRQHLALVALRRQDWKAAQDQARRALGISEDLVLAWNYLGTAQYNLRQPQEALGSWDRALGIEPENLEVLFNVALVAMEIGDRGRARSALERFIAVAPAAQYEIDIARARQLLQQLSE